MRLPRSLTIPLLMSAAVALVGLLFVNADHPVDDLGCREERGKYVCLTGLLAGSTFSSREDAQIEYDFIRQHSFNDKAEVSPSSAEASATVPVIKVISWNIKRSSKEKVDFDRIANVLSDADITALQGLNVEDNGKGPLHILGDLVQQRTGQKICRAWFRAKGKERFAFLWRESVVSLVDQSGELRDPCLPDRSIVLNSSERFGSAFNSVTMFSKPHKRFFHFSSAWLDKKTKDQEIAAAFRTLSPSTWPSIVAGNLQFNPKHAAFKEVKKMDFRATLKGSSNFWIRHAVAVDSGVIDLQERFSETPGKQIEATVSEYFPLLAQIALTDESHEDLQTQMLRAKRETSSLSAKGKRKANAEIEKNKSEFREPTEDLEAEAKKVDGEAAPRKSKKSKKKSKSSTP